MIADRFRLDGRIVVVAGAGGGGIGTSVCVGAGELGAQVVGLDRDEGPLSAAEEATVRAGGRFDGVLVDVTDESAVDAAFASIAERHGGVDGLVHVVGGQGPEHWHAAAEFPMAILDEVLDRNVRSALLTSRAAVRHMLAAGRPGSVVHVSSLAGLLAAPYSLAYGIAKAGLISMTKTTAAEWGRHGIRVNAIGTGTIATPHSRGGEPDAERDAVIALGRRGRPDELAAAVLFALSDLASFITGQTIIVDGGSIIRPSYLAANDMPVFMEDGEIRRRMLGG